RPSGYNFGDSLCTLRLSAQVSRYGPNHGDGSGRDQQPPAPCSRGGRDGVGRTLRPLPQAAAADGPPATGPTASGPRRPLGRPPGGLRRPGEAVPFLRRAARGDAVLPLAAIADRPAADAGPPPASGGLDARRRPRGLAAPRGDAAGQLGVAGGPVA